MKRCELCQNVISLKEVRISIKCGFSLSNKNKNNNNNNFRHKEYIFPKRKICKFCFKLLWNFHFFLFLIVIIVFKNFLKKLIVIEFFRFGERIYFSFLTKMRLKFGESSEIWRKKKIQIFFTKMSSNLQEVRVSVPKRKKWEKIEEKEEEELKLIRSK